MLVANNLARDFIKKETVVKSTESVFGEKRSIRPDAVPDDRNTELRMRHSPVAVVNGSNRWVFGASRAALCCSRFEHRWHQHRLDGMDGRQTVPHLYHWEKTPALLVHVHFLDRDSISLACYCGKPAQFYTAVINGRVRWPLPPNSILSLRGLVDAERMPHIHQQMP
jgi:hypothetical protein